MPGRNFQKWPAARQEWTIIVWMVNIDSEPKFPTIISCIIQCLPSLGWGLVLLKAADFSYTKVGDCRGGSRTLHALFNQNSGEAKVPRLLFHPNFGSRAAYPANVQALDEASDSFAPQNQPHHRPFNSDVIVYAHRWSPIFLKRNSFPIRNFFLCRSRESCATNCWQKQIEEINVI